MAKNMDWNALLFKSSRVFSPAAPVNQFDLFCGRMQQVHRISQAVNTRGRHAMLYGDRGVGKTSLVNILRHVLREFHNAQIVKITCASSDTFISAWAKAMSEIAVIAEGPGQAEEEGNPNQPTEYRLSQYMPHYDPVGPTEIRKLLQIPFTEEAEVIIVFDEFDRLPLEHRRHFADTIKDLSDNSVNATVVLVGVAQDVNELIAEHHSIDRCLTQIPMPPMSKEELETILQKSMKALGMKMDKQASDLIVSLSQGYPHYTHLLGLESTKQAILNRRLTVTATDTSGALKESIEQTQQTVKDDFYKASEGQRKGSLYPVVLLACALTKTDRMGFFRSIDVREPICQLTGKDYDLPGFGTHLEKFSSDKSRGPVLERWGTSRRYRYKFRNPMLKPYVIMKGLEDKLISGSLLEKLSGLHFTPPADPDKTSGTPSVFGDDPG